MNVQKQTAANQIRNLSVELRPKVFSEIIGSEAIVKQIHSQLSSGRIPTAFLFSGPSGTGKTTLARVIGSHLVADLVEVNASDDTGVDAARQLGEDSLRRPLIGNYRVIVMDEAHQLSKAAQNALLKFVEDAPSSTIWIFCTTEPSKLLETLRSRCLSYSLQGLTNAETDSLCRRAAKFIGKEDINYDELVKVLVQEGITAPRSILMAFERYVGGMDPIGAITGAQENAVAFEIARAAAKKDWNAVKTLLSKVTADQAMAVRIVTASYFKSMLLKGQDRAAKPIVLLTADIPFEAGLALSQLVSVLYSICCDL